MRGGIVEVPVLLVDGVLTGRLFRPQAHARAPAADEGPRARPGGWNSGRGTVVEVHVQLTQTGRVSGVRVRAGVPSASGRGCGRGKGRGSGGSGISRT
eukprot:scaffold319832_cov11-Prasinocladus_malaysianus.AAC.1